MLAMLVSLSCFNSSLRMVSSLTVSRRCCAASVESSWDVSVTRPHFCMSSMDLGSCWMTCCRMFGRRPLSATMNVSKFFKNSRMSSEGRPVKAAGVNVLLLDISDSESESTEVDNEKVIGKDVEESDAVELVKSRRAEGEGWATMTNDLGTVSSARDA